MLCHAKAHMSIGKAYDKLGDIETAAKHMSDGLRIFKKTVGRIGGGHVRLLLCSAAHLHETVGDEWSNRSPLCVARHHALSSRSIA